MRCKSGGIREFWGVCKCVFLALKTFWEHLNFYVRPQVKLTELPLGAEPLGVAAFPRRLEYNCCRDRVELSLLHPICVLPK